MIRYEKTDSRIKNLKIDTIYLYLENANWKPFISKRKDISIYQKIVENKLFQAIIPLKKQLTDYYDVLLAAIKTIAETEKQSVQSIILKIENINSIILKIRLDSKNVRSGNTNLIELPKISDQIPRLLKDVANSELKYKNEIIKLSKEDATKYFESCEVGQSEIGSYVLPIILPLNIKHKTVEQETILPSGSPGALIARKILSDISAVIDNAKSELPAEEVANIFEQKAISSEFCDAVNKLVPRSENQIVEFHAEWPKILLQEDIFTEVVAIDSKVDKIKIEKVIKLINEKNVKHRTIIGQISKLKADPDLEKREGGYIDIFFFDNGKKKTITAKLNSIDYHDAVQAHNSGKFIRLIGEIIYKKRGGSIEYTTFEVL